jgi:hypothetical protein
MHNARLKNENARLSQECATALRAMETNTGDPESLRREVATLRAEKSELSHMTGQFQEYCPYMVIIDAESHDRSFHAVSTVFKRCFEAVLRLF